jgi:hypothetical protein
MLALGEATPGEGVCYLTGGATAILIGWRPMTIGVNIALDPSRTRCCARFRG